MNDEERSRIERAKRLREQVKKVVNPESDKAAKDKAAKKEKSEKPRDFIHRRMTELDKEDQHTK